MFKSKYFLFVIPILLILSFFFVTADLSEGFLDGKTSKVTTKLISHDSESSDIYRTSDGRFQKVIYPGQVNIKSGDSYYSPTEFFSVASSNEKILISTIEGKRCFLIPNYTLTNSKTIATTSIDITNTTDSYYFTETTSDSVLSKSYDLECDDFSVSYDSDNDDFLLDNIKIDFTQAKEEQLIKTTYNPLDKKLEFSAVDGMTVDLKLIDPEVTYKFNTTYANISIFAYDWDVNSGSCAIDQQPPNNYSFPTMGTCAIRDLSTSTYLTSIDGYSRLTWTSPALEPAVQEFMANITRIKISDITLLNWSWTGKISLVSMNGSLYIANNSGTWFNFGNITSTTHQNLSYATSDLNFINSSNYTHIVVSTARAALNQFLSTDYVSLEITYDDLILNYPTSTTEVLNTKSININTSQAGYNQSIWASSNSGQTNYTLCANSLECQAQFNFTRQGYFNLTVYANKTTGEQTSETITNLFVGNQTFFGNNETSTSILMATYNPSNPYGSNFTSPNLPNSIILAKGITISATAEQTTKTVRCAIYKNNSLINYTNTISIPANLAQGWYYAPFNNTLEINSSTEYNLVCFGSSTVLYFHYSNNTKTNAGLKGTSVYPTFQSTESFSKNNNLYSIYLNITYYTPNSPPATPTLINPPDGSSQNINSSILFNWTGTDADSDNLTYFVFFDTNTNPTTLINTTTNVLQNTYRWYNHLNSTGGFPDGTYYWKVYAYDSVNNQNVSSAIYSFRISSQAPAITLNYPPNNKWFNSRNNIYFNFTAVDSDGLNTFILYGNWTGSWAANYTWNLPTNNTMNYTILNFSTDGTYKWNVWGNDSTNSFSYALNNLTFSIDTIYPTLSVDMPNGTYTSFSIPLNFSYTEINIDTCQYNLTYDIGGGVFSSYRTNTPIACANTTINVLNYANYRIFLTINDSAGNLNYTSKYFNVTAPPVSPPGGGGGGGGTTVIVNATGCAAAYCGDKICQDGKQERLDCGETFESCAADCGINIDTAITSCFSDDPEIRKSCLFSGSGGIWIFILGLIAVVLIATSVFQIRKNKKYRSFMRVPKEEVKTKTKKK